jgi:uncharacterized protein (TIGR00369 family)
MTSYRDLPARIQRGELQPPPIAKLLGFRLTQIETGKATIEMDADGRHANPMGTLHGGVLCDITDAAMGMALASTLEDGESFTTLELKINFLKPVWTATLKAVGTVVKRGKTVGMGQCDVTDEKDQLVARATCTMMILRGDQAQGR